MDPFSVVVGTLGLVQLCIKSSALLRDAIQSINSGHRETKNLLTEIESLIGILVSLERNIRAEKDTFSSLDFVLEQCTRACDDLNKAVSRALGGRKQSDGIKTWIRLKRQETDIEEFRKLVDSYKATLTIAIADVNLRTTRITKGLLEQYTELSKTATANLEERIEELSAKLELLHSSEKNSSLVEDTHLAEEQQALDQKTSLEQCLSICLKLIEHIHTIRPVAFPDGLQGMDAAVKDQGMSVPRMTNDALNVCTQSLRNTAQHIRDIADEDRSKAEMNEAEVLEQLGGVRKCLEIVRQSEQNRVNIFEKIVQSEDSRVAMVSTIGDLVRGSDINIGPGAISLMGQMSDESLQMGVGTFTSSLTSRSTRPATERPFAFEKKHGSGRTM
ncbi:hypothetical protein C7974DRAFT_413554 [Boeremia exigua]|uniref:uncharacterized protein n=1 Tax=Boeremia exigua TaxID=749465 RepID=UPI001E8D2817|nr:uncharacterized protein C7974DRAFT_413554 [Boeremia exigua]KAH6629795.1 hypothetical protein C7974DRAFT_413554 [Boeremia exigua]